MIRRVHLKNFESHEDSEVEFTDGLNLLIGQSNQGKSSIVRAIALVVANQFDKEQVRTGCEFCEVTVETDRGYVTAQRGEAVNRWEVCLNGQSPKSYKNIGLTVPPDAIDVLGMGEVTHGDISELPNFMFQFERHYMLSEVNGKKATSNMIARMMDDAIGIGGMEELIKAMADDLAAHKRELNSISSEISETRSQLIDEAVFKEYERIMSSIDHIEQELTKDEQLVKDAVPIGLSIDRAKTRLASVESAISVAERALALWREYKKGMEAVNSINRVVSLRRMISRVDEQIVLADKVLAKYKELQDSLEKERSLNRLMKLARVLRSTVISDIDTIVSQFNMLKQERAKAESARALLGEARGVYLDIQRKGRELAKVTSRLSEAHARHDELKGILGVCPLCGARLA